jgi:hypothetical protein
MFGGGTILEAIVRLTGPADFPDLIALNTANVAATALLTVTTASRDYAAPVKSALTPGHYALVFGRGLLERQDLRDHTVRRTTLAASIPASMSSTTAAIS